MRLSNLKLERIEGTDPSNKVFVASVDVESGFLFWKRKERRLIRKKFIGFWRFCDNGEFTPEFQAECLAESWAAQNGDEI